MKALLIQRQVEFPRTHIIGVLLTLCKDSGYVLGENLEEAVHLSEYAVSARYPGEMSEVNRWEAETAVNLANQVFDWVEG